MAEVARTIEKPFFFTFCYFGCWAVGLTLSSIFDSFFVDFLLQHGMAEVAQTILKHNAF